MDSNCMLWLNWMKFSKLVNSEHCLLPKKVEWRNCWTTSEDFEWTDLTSNNLEFEFSTKFWVKTYAYCIQLYKTSRFDSFLTSLTSESQRGSDDFLWPNLISNNFEFQFPTKFWVKTYVYWIYFDQPGQLDGFDPSLTSDDPNWPWKILNLNSWENFESKHMYIGYISTNPPDLTLIRRFDPSLTSFDL